MMKSVKRYLELTGIMATEVMFSKYLENMRRLSKIPSGVCTLTSGGPGLEQEAG